MTPTISRIAATATGALVLALGSTVMSSLAHPGQRSQDIDLTASAHPTDVAPAVTDGAFDVSSVWRRTVRAETSALTSATCDNCSGDATALQVVYAHHPREVAVDNAAVAWARCTGCRGTALSVQVVVVHGSPPITANNRAFATNAACDGCDTAALAYQLVVVAPDAERLSDEASDELRGWVDKQSGLLRQSAAGAARKAADPKEATAGAITLERLVNHDLDSRTDSVDVDRR